MKPKPLFLSIFAAAIAAPAHAIECKDGFQIVQGQSISTPYCRDGELGIVAREHGIRVTDEAIRNSPARKQELCRFLNSNIRAQSACQDVNPDGGRR